MVRQTLSVIAFVFLLAFVCTAQQGSDKSWRFAISGDSRNCGDVVMAGIAKSVLAHEVEFYWHLGDFRIGYDVDEDMQQSGSKPSIAEYHKTAWDDFLTHQVEPFNTTVVHLGIGNHETYMHGTTKEDENLSHAEFVTKFSKWLGDSKTAYNRWKVHHVDFINMDNSGDAGFDQKQLTWLEQVLKEDQSDDVKAVVVGMHRALPNSLACGHSMNGDSSSSAENNLKSLESGRRAYEDLWKFQNASQKHVYVLASHSHLYMQDIFNTAYWRNKNEQDQAILNGVKQGAILSGWLVGTAGAKRYRLPDNLPTTTFAITYAYGYLLATVDSDGAIKFEFQQITENDVPVDVTTKFGKDFVDYCFLGNRDDTPHPPVDSCREQYQTSGCFRPIEHASLGIVYSKSTMTNDEGMQRECSLMSAIAQAMTQFFKT
jgi:hypothetical protein